MLRTLRSKFRVDDRRIYAAGFSNGGFFDYILWAQRGNLFAALCPVRGGTPAPLQITTPRPVFVVAGEQDQRVAIDEQRKTIAALRQINGCAGEGQSPGDPTVTATNLRTARPSSPSFTRAGMRCLRPSRLSS
ncbi:MAG: hypothetical protein WDN28_24275 [Chthoniobacter sp.]